MEQETYRKYYLSQKNMIKVLALRDYTAPTSNDTLEDFIELYKDSSIEEIKFSLSEPIYYKRSQSALSALDKNEEQNLSEAITIKWHIEYKLGVSIRNIVNDLEDIDVNRCIVVVDGDVTSSCREIIKNVKIIKNIIIDVWTLKESMIFAPDHVLVPVHRICSLKEKKEIFKAYGLTKTKLPKIKHDEIIVRYLGANKGQLIEIIRKSETNPLNYALSYRIVV